MPEEAHGVVQPLTNPKETKSELERKLECIEFVSVNGPLDAGGGGYFFEIYFGIHFIGSVIPQRRFAVFSTYKVPENLIPSLRHQLEGYEIITEPVGLVPYNIQPDAA